jgi:hypothetical protein
MSFKSTFLLFGILIGTLCIFGLTLATKHGAGDEGYVLPSLHEEQGATMAIDAVDLHRGGKTYAFVRGDKGWKLSLPPGKQEFRVDEVKVDKIIDQAKNARKSDLADVSRDLEKFGLTVPAATVTLKKKGGGKDWVLNVGNESPDKKFLYVNSSERPRDVFAVPASSLDSLNITNPNDLRSRTLLDVTEFNAQVVQLKEPKGKDGKPVEVSLQKTDQGGWRFQQPPYGAADFEGSTAGKQKREGVKGLINAISTLRVESADDFEPLDATKPLNDYGLQEGQEKLRIEVKTSSGFGEPKTTTPHVLLVGNQVKTKDKDQYYVRLEGDPSVARVDAKKLEPIFKVVSDPRSLRSYDLAQLEASGVDAIDISRGKDLIKLRRPEPTLWKLFTGSDAPRKANVSAIEGEKGLITALQGKRQIKEFFDAGTPEEMKKLEAKLGLDTPAAEVKVWSAGLAPPEKKKDAKEAKTERKESEKKEPETEPKLKADAKPVLTLRFGKADKGLVYVKREAADSSVSFLALPMELLQTVAPANGALAFLDLSVPGFTPDNATQLELLRGPERFEVVRDKEPKQTEFTLKEPKDLPGRTAADAGAVDQVLNILGKLAIKKWVKKIDPKDAKALTPFGLDKPALIATVTVKKIGEEKTESRAFKFGKDTEVAADKPGVYALEGNSDLVFLVDPEIVKILRETELRDRTVFKFDAQKVKEIKLTIRSDKKTLNPVFERNMEGAWLIKAGLENVSLNEDRVNELAALLADLHADKFVSFKGALKPEFKLGEKDASLRIEVLMDDGKTKHELTVGAAKDTTGYYAQSNSLPGVVFLVSQERFRPILDGAKYFTKATE